jgi:modification methylase
MELNIIYNEDCLVTLSKMESESVDLVITSPPYNKGFYANKNAKQSSVWNNLDGRKIGYDAYGDCMAPEDYEAWQVNVLSECMRVLKPTGSIFYNHKDIIYQGLVVVPKWVYSFPVRQQIIWDRQSSCMIDPHYFMPANEWIYWIVKDPKRVYFDKEKSAYRTNIWRVNVEKNPHPAPFPQKLVNSMVASCCPAEGVVYDPFMGSGTVALSVLNIGGGRSYIGSEISANYVQMAQDRIDIFNSELTLF